MGKIVGRPLWTTGLDFNVGKPPRKLHLILFLPKKKDLSTAASTDQGGKRRVGLPNSELNRTRRNLPNAKNVTSGMLLERQREHSNDFIFLRGGGDLN